MLRHFARILGGVCLLAIVAIPFTTGPAWADYPQIRLDSDNTQQLHNEQQICVNPTNPNNFVAVWRDFRLGYRQVGIGYSMDGGVTWTDYLLHGQLTLDSDPVLTVQTDGTFYLVVIDYNDGGANQLAVWKSTNGGATFNGPLVADYQPNGNIFEDKEWMATDRTPGNGYGNLYITWARFYDVKVMSVHSTDGGVSWSSAVQVTSPGTVATWSVPIALKNHNVFCAWDDYYGSKIGYAISTDFGHTWGSNQTMTSTSTQAQGSINGGITVFPYPALAMDETNGVRSGWVYCLYADAAISSNGMDIWLRRSTNGGVSWSSAVRVNDDPAGTGRDQFHPWITCDEFGVLHASWYDRRDDPQNYLWNSYYSRSTDGGVTWAPNIRVSNVSSSPSNAGNPPEQPGGPLRPEPIADIRAGLIGEYSGIAAVHHVAHPVWTDTRNGHQDTYASYLSVPASVGDVVQVSPLQGLTGVPNPTRGGTDLHWSLPVAGAATVEIYDTAGRIVRRLDAGSLPAGDASVHWDGRDDAGRDLPAGVYVARLAGTSPTAGIETKIVLTR